MPPCPHPRRWADWLSLLYAPVGVVARVRVLCDGGHKAYMPPVTHNMILGMRAYRVVNRGIPACGAGIM
eukprot:COSAG06_NODE_31_length_31488_cov_60.882793_6_plen_69_part_00